MNAVDVATLVGRTPIVDISALAPHPRVRLVVPSSGNTGISVATLAGRLGHPTTVVIPGDASPQRIRMLHLLGAEVALALPELGWRGTVAVGERIAASPDAILLDQYDSDLNPAVHRDTTGGEILESIPDLTHFVGAFGTGGSLLGIAHRLKAQRPAIRTLAVEPPPGRQAA